jgi:hypothetical protein
MSNIKYKHEYSRGVEYSEEQAIEIGNYQKEIYTGGRLFNVIDFKNNEPIHISVYLYNNETAADILEDYSTDFNRIELSWRELLYETYWKEYSEEYIDGNLEFKAIDIFDLDRRYVCSVDLDLATGNPELESTEKHFKGELIGPDVLTLRDTEIDFYYDASGSVKSVSVIPEPINQKRNNHISQTEFSDYFPDFFTDYPYYLNADFLPPAPIV